MQSILLITISTCLLGGCSMLATTGQEDHADSSELASATYMPVDQNENSTTAPAPSAFDTSVDFNQQVQQRLLANQPLEVQRQRLAQANQPQDSGKNINYYVRGLMQDLVGNLQYVNNTTPVAISDFVMLDSDYTKSNLLGNQIAESLMHEVHKLGIPLIDYKTTDYIRVTPRGDFAFSKDYEDLSGYSPIRYVVAGTMLKYNDGYLVNARIVGIESKAVVATAQSFIPGNVADAIMLNHKGVTPQEVKPDVNATLISIVQG
jgi:TolB-like protein